MDPNTSYDFSSALSTSAQSRRDAHNKRWSWLNKLVNKTTNEPLYSSRIISQEFDPQPNWFLLEIDVEKIYDLPMFRFRAASLFLFTSVNIPISLSQSVYQIPLIKRDDIEWGMENGYNYIHIGLIHFDINSLV